MGCSPSTGNASSDDGTATTGGEGKHENSHNSNSSIQLAVGTAVEGYPTTEAQVYGHHRVTKVVEGGLHLPTRSIEPAAAAAAYFTCSRVEMRTTFESLLARRTNNSTSTEGDAGVDLGASKITQPPPLEEGEGVEYYTYQAASKALRIPTQTSDPALEAKVRSVCDISRGGLVAEQLKRLRSEPREVVRWPVIFGFDGSGAADFVQGKSALSVPGIRVFTEWCERGNIVPLMGSCTVAQATVLLSDVAAALDTLHRMGCAHLDLHAGNVLRREVDMSASDRLVGHPEERYQVGEVGWGPLWSLLSAKERWCFQCGSGGTGCTAGRFSPEQISAAMAASESTTMETVDDKMNFSGFGGANPSMSNLGTSGLGRLVPEEKTDVWAFGVLAFTLLYNKQPFGLDLLDPPGDSGSSGAGVGDDNREDNDSSANMVSYFRCIMDNNLHFPPESAQGELVPLPLRSMILSCLTKDPHLRPRSLMKLMERCIIIPVGDEVEKVNHGSNISAPRGAIVNHSTVGGMKRNSKDETTPVMIVNNTVVDTLSLDSDDDSGGMVASSSPLQGRQHSSTLESTKSANSSTSSTAVFNKLGKAPMGSMSRAKGGRNSATQVQFREDVRRGSHSSGGTSPHLVRNKSVTIVDVIDTHATGGTDDKPLVEIASESTTSTINSFRVHSTNDILIAPGDFKVVCSSCQGSVAPLAFRCDSCPNFILCADCLVETGDAHDQTHRLTSYAVEEMDEMRLEASLGTGLWQSGKNQSNYFIHGGDSRRSSLAPSISVGGGFFGAGQEDQPDFGSGSKSTGLFGRLGGPTMMLRVENLEETAARDNTARNANNSMTNPLSVLKPVVVGAGAILISNNTSADNSPISQTLGVPPTGMSGPPSPGGQRSAVFVKTENLTPHEKTIFSMMGHFPETQLTATKKRSFNQGAAVPGNMSGFGGGGISDVSAEGSFSTSPKSSPRVAKKSPGLHEMMALGGTTTSSGQCGGKKQLMSEEDAHGDLDPDDVIDEYLRDTTTAMSTREATATEILGAGTSPSSGGTTAEISLCSFNLGEVPRRLETLGADLSMLSILDLSNNRIQILPDWIGIVPVNLKQLRLGSNLLSELPETLGELSQLEILELNHNQLTDIPVTLVFLDNLQTLSLDYNDFNGIPDCIWSMPQLSTLYVAANPNIVEWPAIEQLCPMGHLTIGVDNHPKLWKSYRDLLIGEQCHWLNVVWNKVYPDCVIPDRVYLGSLKSAQLTQVYERLGIGAVLTVARGLDPVIGPNMRHKTIVVDDIIGASFEQSFEEAFAFIDSCPTENAQGNPAVLVHCFAGMSRSATALIGYLMTNHKMRLDDAYLMAKDARAVIYPNDGFFDQLVGLDEKLYPASEGHRPLKIDTLGRGEIPGLSGGPSPKTG